MNYLKYTIKTVVDLFQCIDESPILADGFRGKITNNSRIKNSSTDSKKTDYKQKRIDFCIESNFTINQQLIIFPLF